MNYGRYLSEKKDEFKGMAGNLDEKDGFFTFVKEFPKKSTATIVGVGDDYVVLSYSNPSGLFCTQSSLLGISQPQFK